MIPYIENKEIRWENIKSLLSISQELNHWANFGPLHGVLEAEIRRHMDLEANHKAVMCSSGTTATHAVINMYCHLADKRLKWVASSFNFPSCVLGNLHDCVEIVDCDLNGILSLDQLEGLEYDGIIVTDLFGTIRDRTIYSKFAKENDKILIFDSALAFDKIRTESHVEIISFHHTKPWGMGEGGCVILPSHQEPIIRSIINLGREKNSCIDNSYLMNAKLSDLSSAFILDRVKQMHKVRSEYLTQYYRILDLSKKYGFEALGRPLATPSNVPLLYNKPVFNLKNQHLMLNKVYEPLKPTKNATSLYRRMINFPCHNDVINLSDNEIDEVFDILQS